MSTKVKGDKIKEGSISYEALDKGLSFVPALSEFVKKLTTEDINTSIEIPYASQIHIFIGSQNKIIRITTGQSYTIEDYGDSVTLSVSQSGSSLTLNISNMKNPSLIEGFNIYIYKNLNKIRTEFLPTIETPTPDWNAQEGEAGYIENRTHYHSNTVKFKYNDSDDLYEIDYVPSDEGLIYIEDTYDRYRKYEIPSIETSEDGRSGYDWSNALTITFWDASEEYYGEFKVGYSIDNYKVVAIYNENEADVDYDSRIKNMNIFNVVQIESEYIPNTVIKTTPQTLSNTDKNQALANLGIDPVVWKYMCNPHSVYTGNIIPNELLEIVNNRVVLKYKFRNMYDILGSQTYSEKIKEFSDDSIMLMPRDNIIPTYYIEINTDPVTPGSLGTYIWEYREDEEA